MPEDDVEQGGIGGALSRPIGPLPVWAWALVIVGGFLLYRIVKGGGSSSGSTGTALGFGGFTSGGNDNTAAGGGTVSSDVDAIDSAGLQKLLKNIAANTANIRRLSNLEVLNNHLELAINARAGVLSKLSYYRGQVIQSKAAYAACRTTACRNTIRRRIAFNQSRVATYQKSLTTINGTISGLEKQIQTVQHTVTIAPPSTTSTNAAKTATTSGSNLSQPTITVK